MIQALTCRHLIEMWEMETEDGVPTWTSEKIFLGSTIFIAPRRGIVSYNASSFKHDRHVEEPYVSSHHGPRNRGLPSWGVTSGC